MKSQNIKNIGLVNLEGAELGYSSLRLYIPIDELSESLAEKYNEVFNRFVEGKNIEEKEVIHDISIYINLNGGELEYSLGIILWTEDTDGNVIDECDSNLFEIELSDADASSIKKRVIEKLTEEFFN